MSADQGVSEVDPTQPSIARVYDAFLDGKDNFEVDRAAKQHVLSVLPQARTMAIANREWLERVVRFLSAEIGIDQYLDLGAGLPTKENTHQVAQRYNSEAEVVYVDNDPACQAFGRSLLEDNEHTHCIAGDLTEPDKLLNDPVISRKLDFDRPIALIQCATLHHVPDRLDPRGIMKAYIDALPAGSYIAITHFFDPQDDSDHYSALARELSRVAEDNGMEAGFWRPRGEIESYFNGLELVEPGLTLLPHWWPDGPMDELKDADHLILGGLARKP